MQLNLHVQLKTADKMLQNFPLMLNATNIIDNTGPMVVQCVVVRSIVYKVFELCQSMGLGLI